MTDNTPGHCRTCQCWEGRRWAAMLRGDPRPIKVWPAGTDEGVALSWAEARGLIARMVAVSDP